MSWRVQKNGSDPMNGHVLDGFWKTARVSTHKNRPAVAGGFERLLMESQL
jgi:hypothetical protein